MAAPRYDVAREWINGRKASNSTKSFRSELDPDGTATIYTYNVALARRFPNGDIECCYECKGPGWGENDTPVRTLDRRYSVTSTTHQTAVKAVIANPLLGQRQCTA